MGPAYKMSLTPLVWREKMEGLLGSCVVIPCSYNYPDIAAHTFTGIWRIDDQVIYHPTESNTMEKYKGRTKLLGDLSKKNCSLMIENLQQSDGGPFFFRIELEGPNKFSYSNNKVSISMIGEPNPTDFFVQEEVKEGQTVSAFCSVSHSCPTYPPSFHWSHSGEQHFQTQNLQNGQWKAASTLTFRSDRTDNNKPLRCRVTYHGGKQREPSKTIKVKCKCAALTKYWMFISHLIIPLLMAVRCDLVTLVWSVYSLISNNHRDKNQEMCAVLRSKELKKINKKKNQ
uniref:Sialic acid-binding Ig-like lectin 14 n=1 Tax=Pundamilia nyererei TaxID=303518 RepID=A0A3B4FM92_9CICH